MTVAPGPALVGRALRGLWWLPLVFVAVLVGCSTASVEATVPEPTATPARPPSKAATRSSKTAFVGLVKRV